MHSGLLFDRLKGGPYMGCAWLYPLVLGVCLGLSFSWWDIQDEKYMGPILVLVCMRFWCAWGFSGTLQHAWMVFLLPKETPSAGFLKKMRMWLLEVK